MKHNHVEQRIIHRFRIIYGVTAFLTSLTMTAVLLLTVANLPEYGKTGNPVENEVFSRYVEHGLKETGAVNIVAAVILDYRAFDTLGEILVLFTALASVLMLLRDERMVVINRYPEQIYNPEKDQIFRVVVLILTPCLLTFGAYVVVNGHISAGGGFAGGAILGAAMIMYHIAFGLDKIRRFLDEKTFHRIIAGALTFYCFAKGYSFFMGGNNLTSGIPLGNPGSIFSAGLILPLNIAVGVVVACTVYGFFSLSNRGETYDG